MTTWLPSVASRSVISRAGKFALVGGLGLVVNLVTQVALTELIGVNYLVSAVLATQVSTTFNFVFAEIWVFHSGGEGMGVGARFASFLLMSNIALVFRTPMIWFLADVLGVHYALANLASLVVLTVVRFSVADRLIWKTPLQPDEATIGAQGSRLASRLVVDGAYALGGEEVMVIHESGDQGDSNDLEEPRPSERMTTPVPLSRTTQYVGLTLVVAVGAFLRLWGLMAVGFNSDEAVYASQAAGIAGDQSISQFFPVFRAHPFLFQAILSVPYQLGVNDTVGRLMEVGFGLATIVLVFFTARLLYNARVGLIAAGIVALLPYHIIITRQVLLDGPTTFFATLSIYLTARYAVSRRLAWLLAASCALGLTTLTKETYIILVGSMFMFFALSPEIRLRLRDIVAAVGVFFLTLLPYPISIVLAGKSETGKSYLSWQLFRRPNHGYDFYFTTLPHYLGWLVLAGAVVGLWATWGRRRSWKERLLLSWIIVPTVFLTIWPVKGFHYLLAASIPLVILAAMGIDVALARISDRLDRRRSSTNRVARPGTIASIALLGVIALSLAIPSWAAVQPATSDTFLAGMGGVPGGREMGEWIAENTPEGARFMTVGPSMANLIQWYGQRKANGLSVSPNPLNRNPSYEPIVNPDRAIRTNELQYVVWDAYSTARSQFFGDKVIAYSDRYHGKPVFTYESDGKPVIVVFEVRP